MYMPSPEPPRCAVLPELGEHPAADLRGDAVALVVDVQQHARERRLGRSASTVTVTLPSPCRIAFSTRLVTTWANLSGSALTLRQVVGDVELDLAARCRRAPTATTRSTSGRDVARAAGSSESRPVSMRATSSSSAISRLSRSASALTVVEHQLLLLVVEPVPRLSSAWHEALDAGQRRAQLVGDGGDQVGALAVEPLAAARRAQRRPPTRLDRAGAARRGGSGR